MIQRAHLKTKYQVFSVKIEQPKNTLDNNYCTSCRRKDEHEQNQLNSFNELSYIKKLFLFLFTGMQARNIYQVQS